MSILRDRILSGPPKATEKPKKPGGLMKAEKGYWREFHIAKKQGLSDEEATKRAEDATKKAWDSQDG